MHVLVIVMLSRKWNREGEGESGSTYKVMYSLKKIKVFILYRQLCK